MHYSRRIFLNGFVSFAGAYGLRVFAKSPENDAGYSDQVAADGWMRGWTGAFAAESGALFVGRFADRVYFLTKQIGWKPNPGQEGHLPVQVPVGFVTDFASIPRLFWSVLPPDGLYTYPAIVHDYLYWEQPVSRDEADLILLYGMEDFKVGAKTIKAIYEGVRLGGASPWKSNAALKASGEKRVLKVFPTDPTTRWDDWKIKPGVFG